MQEIKWAQNNTPAQTATKKIERLEKKLLHYVGKAIGHYQMIQKNDRVMVCVSGGKDSLTLLMLLDILRQRTKHKFEILAFTLDQGHPGWDDTRLRDFFKTHNIAFDVVSKDTFSIVKEKIPEGNTYCSLCSRLRRGNIYGYAAKHGFNKIALGHHREDLINTLLMSIFYNGIIRSMPPKLLSDDKQHVVIRPLSYCQEKDIAEYAQLREFPIIPCNLCGSQENLTRKKINRLIQSLAQENPKVPSNMLRALQRVAPSQLMDQALWNFKELELNQKFGIQDELTTEEALF